MRLLPHLQKFARVAFAVCIVAGLLVLPGLPAIMAPIPAYAFFADGPYTVTLNTDCNSGFHFCASIDFTGLGQIDGLAIVDLEGGDPSKLNLGTGCRNGIGCGSNAPAWNVNDSEFYVANGNPRLCWRRVHMDSVCDTFFGAGLWTPKGDNGLASSFGALSGHFFNTSPGRTVTFYVLYSTASATSTPTPTSTATPTDTPNAATQTQAAGLTQTQYAGQTQTQYAGQTQTPLAAQTQTQAAGQTQTQGVHATATQAAIMTQSGTHVPGSQGGNLIRNWDFNIGPLQSNSEWATINHVVQAPLSLADPLSVAHLPYGSCGDKYWDMDQPGSTSGPAGSIFQDFQWPGGSMFVNFEAVTDSYLTYGTAKIVNKDTGGEYTFTPFANGTNAWVSFKFLAPAQPAGRYSLNFSELGVSKPNALVVDNVNVRTGYWGNDCPANMYHGTVPNNGTVNPTATPAATATYVPGAAGANAIQNCDFENGQQNWTSNPAVAFQTTGGATGPTYAQLFNLILPSFPVPLVFHGDTYQPFNWAGGSMYTSFWLKDGSSIVMHLKNVATDFKLQVFTSSPAKTDTGWTKYNAVYQPDGPGQYNIEFEVPAGSLAGLDGVAVSPGMYATGGCATQGDSNGNATQVSVNQTATAAGSPTAGAQTSTANAQATDDANAYATYAAGFYQTATAIWQAASTAAAAQTQTAAVHQTAVEGERSTATAQGTAVATATMTPFPANTRTPTYPPPATVVIPPPTLTQIANDANATITAIWGGVQTAQAAASQTQGAAGTATQSAAKTSTAAAAANQTAQAIVNATAFARQTATAARATQAQATYNAGATQTALVIGGNATHIAAATQTQAAQQTQTQVAVMTANYFGTQHAAATQTALVATGDAAQVATATQRAALTQTAIANATTQANGTAQAQQTQQAHATGTAQAAATQTALATLADATANAAATLTAVATVAQIATEGAQATVTAQAQLTQQVQGTQEVEPRPEPGPYVDCVRPTNPLWLADWVDYEFCRLMTWFVWSPTNSQQVSALQTDLGQYEPLGTLLEISNARNEIQDQLYAYDWARTGVQQAYTETTLIPDIGVFFPNHVATGLLAGNLDLTPNPIDPLRFLTICSLKVGDIFGQAVAEGLCASINWMIAIGIMGWVQYLFDVVVWFAFIRYGWHTVTVTIPTML